MESRLDFWKFLRLLIPTLCLAYVLSGSTWGASPTYRETFGSGDQYLDLYFDTNPQGYFQKNISNKSVPFFGFFVNGNQQTEIKGKYFREGFTERYVFETGEGKFVGTISPGIMECEPKLGFEIKKDPEGTLVQSGSLKAAFCR